MKLSIRSVRLLFLVVFLGIAELGGFALYARVFGVPSMQARMPEFERLVAEQRAKAGNTYPLRVVVFDEDQSAFVTANSFEQVIYDESDEIGKNSNALQGYWPSPLSDTGVIGVGYGRKSIQPLGNHFYHVWITDW